MTTFLRDSQKRYRSIIDNTPDKFFFRHQKPNEVDAFKSGITENRLFPDPFGGGLFGSLQDNFSAGRYIRHNQSLIDAAASEKQLSPDLLKAVLYTEMSRGWYDRANPLGSSTKLPGNLLTRWQELIPGSDVEKKEDNIRLAAKLIKRIEERLEVPHPEDIYSLYNSLAHEQTYENAKTKNTPFFMKQVLENKAWEKKKWHMSDFHPNEEGVFVPNSFAPGTSIMMADGRLQPIESLQTGDAIVSYDEAGRLVPGVVHDVFEHTTDEFLCLKFVDGRPPLLLTPGHQVQTLDGDHDAIINLVEGGRVMLLDHNGRRVEARVTRLTYDEDTVHLLPEDENGEGWITYNLEVDPHDRFIAGGIRVADRPDEGEIEYEEAVLAALIEEAAIEQAIMEELLAEEAGERADNDPHDYSTVVTSDGRLIPPQEAPKSRRKKPLTEAEDYAGFVTSDGRLIMPPA